TGNDRTNRDLSHLTRTSGQPNKEVKPHGWAIGFAAAFPGADHFRDFDMLNDFRRALVASATVVGLGTTLVACGGGGGGAAADTTQAPATTSSADAVSKASDTTQAPTTTSSAGAVSNTSDTSDTSSVVSVSPVKPVDVTSSAGSSLDLT